MPSSSPTDAKRRAGNAGGRPIRYSERNGAVPDVPPTLGEHGQRAWVELWQAGDWLSPSLHMRAMTLLCENFDEREVWAQEIRKHAIVKGSMGQRRPNPAAMQLRALEGSMRGWLKELGFFGAHQEAGPVDDLDKFLGRLPS